MNVEFTTYSPETGELLAKYSIPSNDMSFYAKTPYVMGHHIMGHHNSQTDYFNLKTRQVLPRPLFPASLRSAEEKRIRINEPLRLRDIPKGTTVSLENQSYTVDDGVFEWSSPIPMETEIRIENFPYIPSNIKVVVTE